MKTVKKSFFFFFYETKLILSPRKVTNFFFFFKQPPKNLVWHPLHLNVKPSHFKHWFQLFNEKIFNALNLNPRTVHFHFTVTAHFCKMCIPKNTVWLIVSPWTEYFHKGFNTMVLNQVLKDESSTGASLKN